jgi:hypothetical protein
MFSLLRFRFADRDQVLPKKSEVIYLTALSQLLTPHNNGLGDGGLKDFRRKVFQRVSAPSLNRHEVENVIFNLRYMALPPGFKPSTPFSSNECHASVGLNNNYLIRMK